MPRRSALLLSLLSAMVTLGACLPETAGDPPDGGEVLRVLFLGDSGPHRPADRAAQIIPALAERGIRIRYTEELAALDPENLAGYDAVLIYANAARIEPPQERALLDYVAQGGGLVPIHCASYCFLNSPDYVALVGAQFLRHGTGVFRESITENDHPVMRGFGGFESWDETYVHHRHNDENRVVLSYRLDTEGREPWTWVRQHGKGRVFYTAWGHDARTWGHPGFQNLVERGIRWAAGGDPSLAGPFAEDPTAEAPKMTPRRTDVKPFEYVDAKIAFYPPASDRKGDGGWNKMQLPLEPEESLKHMVVPEGFRVELFAAEPDIGKPICMNWDERGRLWIAESVDYPNELQPPGRGRDRIKICEDTDGDGRADRFTVFADRLSIPTSLAFSRGGVVVHQAPETLFLRDEDGDDRADRREVLFRGWSTGDSHAGPSNLQQGLDNWLWGMQGYAGFEGNVGGERRSFRQGFYRFRPDGSRLEFLRSTDNNTWGLGFSEEGIVFGSTANRNPSVYMPIPNRFYEAVRGWSPSQLGGIADSHLFRAITDRIRQVDHHGGYTSAAGHALYTARTYPRRYWNRTAFVCEPTGHLVGVFVPRPVGSDFTSTNPFNLLASDDEWAAPTMAEVGPDGHVWVIDWYNYIVQHNPTPAGFKTGKGNAYETDLRDKKHGRVYRVIYGGAAPSSPTALDGASPDELVQALRADNLFWRRHAQRLLVERGRADVVPALVALAEETVVDKIGLNTASIHALWTLHGLGAFEGDSHRPLRAAAAALKHPSAGVRRTALDVLPRTERAARDVLAAGLLADREAQVRLTAFLALAEMPASHDVAAAVLEALRLPANSQDRWIPDAATCAAAAHDLPFLKELATRHPEQPPDGKIRELAARVAEHYARGIPADSVGGLVELLVDSDPAVAEAIVSGLARGWPREQPAELDDRTERSMIDLLAKLPPSSKGQLATLAARWGSKGFEKHAAEISASLLAIVRNSQEVETNRVGAALRWIEFRKSDGAAAEQLLALLTPRTPPGLAAGILDAVARSESPDVGNALVQSLATATPALRPAILRALLARTDWTETLLESVEQGKIQMAELALDQRQALTGHPNRSIASRARELLARGGGLPDPDRQRVIDELAPAVLRPGDPAKGKEVFKNHCAKCHVHGGEGNRVGPDLTGMAVHPKEELLLNTLDPSRSVEGNFRQYAVATDDGRVLAGLLASETNTSVELVDAEGKRHTILRENIEELVASSKSLMPEGFEKLVAPEAIADLLEFLTQRGRYLPLDLRKAATILSTQGMFYSRDADVERLIFSDWSPKVFEGIPFHLVDPQNNRVPNVILLHGPQGRLPPGMPRSVSLPCHAPARAIHLLSGVSGWGYNGGSVEPTVSMIVRLHYEDGTTEDHPLKNGVHFADYIRPVDVPGSKLAFRLRGQQIRYLAIEPKRPDVIERIELRKGPDHTAPVVMAVTVESP